VTARAISTPIRLALALAAALIAAAPVSAQMAQPETANVASHRPTTGAVNSRAQTPTPTAETDDGSPPPVATDAAPPGAIVHIPDTSTPQTTRTNGSLTGLGNPLGGLSAGVAWLALVLALAACGLVFWLRYMSPLRALANESVFEEDLRGLIREEMDARQGKLVATLKAEIARLETRIAELESGAPAAFPAAAPEPERQRGPGRIAPDFHTPDAHAGGGLTRARAPLDRARPAPRAPEQPIAERPIARPAVTSGPRGHELAINALKSEADFGRMLELYRRSLAGERGALADFIELHQPVGVAEDADGRFQTTDDSEPAIWFVEVANSDTHGVLLPAFKVMRDWDRSYRPMSGHKATAVFGSSYDILPGDRLSVPNPAWANRTGAATFERVARGELIGR
jgi:hypothetical protein